MSPPAGAGVPARRATGAGGAGQAATTSPVASSPLAAARALHDRGERIAFLAGGAESRPGRRSFLATAPDDEILTAPEAGGGLPAIAPRLVHVAHGEGIWIGAITYDAGRELLGVTSRHDPVHPAFAASYHRTYATFDHADGTWTIVGPEGRARRLLEKATTEAPEDGAERTAVAARRATGVGGAGWGRARHERAAEEIRRLIAAGEVFEVNLAHVLETPWTEGGFRLFERLLDASGAVETAAYLVAGEVEYASASPELLLLVEGSAAETRPIKGTRPRGGTAVADEEAARELLGNVKDRAENVMIVDLLRNDLVATAVPGSVSVAELCTLERTTSVMHLVSAVRSTIAEGVRLPDVLVSLLPGGSITGAPKRRAMEIIDRLEPTARGIYCGSIFAWEPGLDRLVASVAIRTAAVTGGVARYGAGGAVTLLSDPAEEATETIVKARVFLEAANARLEGW